MEGTIIAFGRRASTIQTRFAGHTHSIPRYYAINVELKNIIFL